MIEWKIQGSRVYGNGQGYNCTNRVTAEQLHNTLNNYEKTIQLHTNLEQQFDKIQKGVIQLQMSLKLAQDDLDKIKKEMDI